MKNSSIEWTDHTFNPWIGCTKVSPGCDHCYAEQRMDKRLHVVNWGPGAPRKRTSAKNWEDPEKWNANHEAFFAQHGRRQRVFCASLADVFDNEVPVLWRADLLALINETPNLDWLLLTKRIGNAERLLREALVELGNGTDALVGGGLPPNVWLGATIVNQTEADRDIPKLLAVPAARRFLSMEPLLGPVDLTQVDDGAAHRDVPREEWGTVDDEDSPPGLWWNVLTGQRTIMHGGATGDWSRTDAKVDWVIVGGESGPGARPMHPDWVRSLRDQCQAAGVPFLFKQWGEWRDPLEDEEFSTAMGRAQKTPAFIVAPTGTVHCFENDQTRDGGTAMLRIGKKAAGRLLDGRTWDEVPA